jgi:radical SAM-linked protein
VRYSKLGKIRFTSHRDTCNHWERAVRRAGVRVAQSNGFTPRPKMSFGLGLPTAAESLAEYLDITLADEADSGDLAELRRRFDDAMPDGYGVGAVVVADGAKPSLQEDVVACRWLLTVADVDSTETADAIASLLAADRLVIDRVRKGQPVSDDIRPAVESLAVDGVDARRRPVVAATLSTAGRGLRPGELLSALFPGRDPLDAAARVLRTHQWIDRDGERQELVPLPVAEKV